MKNQTKEQHNLSNFPDTDFLQIDELINQLKLVERFNLRTKEFASSKKVSSENTED